MSILIEFFIAPDDAAAATALDGGPEGRFTTVSDYGSFLVFQAMVEWESLLTGREISDLLDADEPRTVADDGGTVFAASPALQRALTTADEATLADLGRRWKQDPEGVAADFDPEMIDSLLQDLAELARTAGDQGYNLYCWMC